MRIVSRLLRRLGIHVWQIFTRPLSPAPPPVPAGIALRVIDERDPAALWADPGLQTDARKAAEAFSRGEVCFGAFAGEKLAGYAWFTRQPAPHSDGIWMDFDRGAVYIYRAFVAPHFRGRGIAPALFASADALFLQRGCQFAVLCIEAANAASLAAARRAGSRRVGYAAYWHGGGRLKFTRTPGVAQAGFSFFLPKQ